MSFSTAKLLIGGCVAAALLSGVPWSYEYLSDRRRAAASAFAQRAACQELAVEIRQLRAGPAVASAPSAHPDIGSEIAAAARAAELSNSNIDRIEHDPPRHPAAGAAIELPTRIVLRQTSLRQLVTLLRSLDRPADALRIERVHLIAPNDTTIEESWTAEATVVSSAPAGSNEPR